MPYIHETAATVIIYNNYFGKLIKSTLDVNVGLLITILLPITGVIWYKENYRIFIKT